MLLHHDPLVCRAAANQRKINALQQLAPLTAALNDVDDRVTALLAGTTGLELG